MIYWSPLSGQIFLGWQMFLFKRPKCFCCQFFWWQNFAGVPKIFGWPNFWDGKFFIRPNLLLPNISVLKSHIDWRSKYCLVQSVWKITTFQLWQFFLEEWVWEKNTQKNDPDDAFCSDFENNRSQQLKRYRSRNLSLFLPCKNKKGNKKPAGGLDFYFHPWFSDEGHVIIPLTKRSESTPDESEKKRSPLKEKKV